MSNLKARVDPHRKSPYFIIGIIFISILTLCKLFLPDSPKAIDPRVLNGIKILISSDTIHISKLNSMERNFQLVDLLEQRRTGISNYIISLESVRMQSRIIYSAIVVGLLSLLFSLDSRSDKIRSPIRKKLWICLTLFISIILMYFLEVHIQDLINRHHDPNGIIAKACEDLLNLNSNDTTFYIINTQELVAELDSAGMGYKPIFRKTLTALKPNLEQWIYYMIPLLSTFLIAYYYSKKLKNINGSNNTE